MIVRKARVSDGRKMAEINVLCWHITYKGLFSDSFLNDMQVTDKRVANFERYIQERGCVLVAEENHQVVGYLMAGKGTNDKIPLSYEIYGLYVDPNSQRKGAGTALMNAFKKEIGNAGFYLYVAKGNQPAKCFYEKMGLKAAPEYDMDHIFREEKMPCVAFLFK